MESPLKKGVPALAVVDGHGKVIYAMTQGEFENMRNMDPASVNQFLEKWKPEGRVRSGRMSDTQEQSPPCGGLFFLQDELLGRGGSGWARASAARAEPGSAACLAARLARPPGWQEWSQALAEPAAAPAPS